VHHANFYKDQMADIYTLLQTPILTQCDLRCTFFQNILRDFHSKTGRKRDLVESAYARLYLCSYSCIAWLSKVH